MINEINAKSIVIKQKHPEYWFNFEYNMNLYKGCCFGCIYCDSRSDCYHNENFDQIKIKKNALEIVKNELKGKRYKGVVGTGSMSDPYNPYEKETQLTRGALQLIKKYGFGVGICTKSKLVERDVDVLSEIQKVSMVIVNVTITASEDEIGKKIEPHAPLSSERFNTLKLLADKQIFGGVLMTPLLPFITGNIGNVKKIVEMAAEAGVPYIYPSFGLTMRDGNREYLYENLDTIYPGLSEKYKDIYGNNYVCNIPNAKEVSKVFVSECKKNGILFKMEDIIKKAKEQVIRKQVTFF